MAQASVDCNDTGGSVLSEPQSSAWKCPTIDFHHHLLAHEGYVDQLLMAMDAAGIDKVCLNGLGVPSANWLGDTSPGNTEAEQAWRLHPERIIPIASLRLGVHGAAHVRELHERGFVGLKTTRPLRDYDHPSFDEVYAAAAERGMSILFHTGFIVRSLADDTDDVSSARTRPVLLDRVARTFPDLKIVMAHLGMPWFEEAAQMCRFHDNVYTDLSGSMQGWRNRMAPADLARLLWWPGAFKKVVFGSDVPPWEIGAAKTDYLRILDLLDLPQEVKAAVMGGTAATLTERAS